MPKLFVSYAEEDSKFVHEIVELLKSNLGEGWEISDWQDPSQRGYQWIDKIEKDISEANAFIALVSPHYLASPWCILERNMALRRNVDFLKVNNRFLWVAEVDPTEKKGFLADFDWINLIDLGWEERLIKGIVEGLKQMKNFSMLPQQSKEENISWHNFQNRTEELDDLINNLMNVAGNHFWQLISAPQMGKSRLVQRLPIELTQRDPNWKIKWVDLREEEIDARSNLEKLLFLFIGQQPENSNTSNQIIEYAKKLARENTRMLWILDSAELLSTNNAKRLRESISKIYKLLEESDKPSARLAFVAASRRYIQAWREVKPPPPFVYRTLSHFKIGVIEEFLRDIAKTAGSNKNNNWIRNISRKLKNSSEGLPGLLVIYMGWIKDSGFIVTEDDDIESQELFSNLAKPYITNYLLSTNSLLPSSENSDLDEPRRSLLEKVLLGLSIYRCFTETVFHQFMDENGGLNNELEKSKWTRDELWLALRMTCLVEPQKYIMIRLYPSVRRLLFRYKYFTCEEQIQAHLRASDFYFENLKNWDGTDIAVYLSEYKWHQIEIQRLTKSTQNPPDLESIARTLYTKKKKRGYTFKDLLNWLEECQQQDEELLQALSEVRSIEL